MGDEKVPLRADLTTTAYSGWQRVTIEHGVTVTALLEVLGLRLDETGGDLRAVIRADWPGIVAEARTLAASRRRRPRG